MLERTRNWFEQELYASRIKKGKCGCGGRLYKLGCESYLYSDGFDNDVSIEVGIRASGGLGFGCALGYGAHEAVMSMHLQEFGMTPKQADEALTR